MTEHPGYQDLHRFTGKVVVVTGSSSGIGAQIAARFAEAGATVVLNANQNEKGLQQAAERIRGMGGKVLSVPADISETIGAETLLAETIAKFGRIDVLVNNAGVQPLKALMDMDAKEWDFVVGTNLRGTFLCTQQAAKRMIAQGEGGAIINISSIEAQSPALNHSHYGASKAGINNFTKASALELGQYGIRINAVLPGLIDTGGLEHAWPVGVRRWKQSAPLQRTGHGLDVADACLFLASPAARWITGAILPVDGGVLAQQTY
jgi:NAD(P)-dependent dehydrogenase (short-subunit alcohol dehydrogenase family)